MAEEEKFRPYAAPANVLAVLNRVRARNLPEAINNDFLRIAGMPEAVFGRVLQALRFLNLIHEDGRLTEKLRAISGAPEARYRELLGNAVREAYRDDFAIIDPASDLKSRITDAFRPYQPRSQTSRMVILFLGLCREAGIPVLDAPRERGMKAGSDRSTKSRATAPRKQEEAAATSLLAPPRAVSESLFNVTEEDIAFLDEAEFQEVWTALGKVARARARARRQQQDSIKTQEEMAEQQES